MTLRRAITDAVTSELRLTSGTAPRPRPGSAPGLGRGPARAAPGPVTSGTPVAIPVGEMVPRHAGRQPLHSLRALAPSDPAGPGVLRVVGGGGADPEALMTSATAASLRRRFSAKPLPGAATTATAVVHVASDEPARHAAGAGAARPRAAAAATLTRPKSAAAVLRAPPARSRSSSPAARPGPRDAVIVVARPVAVEEEVRRCRALPLVQHKSAVALSRTAVLLI